MEQCGHDSAQQIIDPGEKVLVATAETSPEQWFAIQVRTRWESSTAKTLQNKGYEILLPTYSRERRWGSRVRGSIAPLFPGYVFCRFDVQKRLPILVTPGVIGVVGRGRVPVAVAPSEIAAIERLVSSGVPAEPWPYLEVGQRVRIEDHALQGLEGILMAFKGSQRVVISVSLLQRSVALEIDRARIIPLQPARKNSLEKFSECPLIAEAITQRQCGLIA
jgi:transcription antitermination factor NusG